MSAPGWTSASRSTRLCWNFCSVATDLLGGTTGPASDDRVGDLRPSGLGLTGLNGPEASPVRYPRGVSLASARRSPASCHRADGFGRAKLTGLGVCGTYSVHGRLSEFRRVSADRTPGGDGLWRMSSASGLIWLRRDASLFCAGQCWLAGAPGPGRLSAAASWAPAARRAAVAASAGAARLCRLAALAGASHRLRLGSSLLRRGAPVQAWCPDDSGDLLYGRRA